MDDRLDRIILEAAFKVEKYNKKQIVKSLNRDLEWDAQGKIPAQKKYRDNSLNL